MPDGRLNRVVTSLRHTTDPADTAAMPAGTPCRDCSPRRAQSLTALRAEGIPWREEWPPLPSTAGFRRDDEQVALRAIALCHVAVKAGGLPAEVVRKLARRYAIGAYFSPIEATFIADQATCAEASSRFQDRHEAYAVMLWALGFARALARPDLRCDSEWGVAVLRGYGRQGFLQLARLRSQEELLDAADLHFCFHQACLEARSAGWPAPGGLLPEVVAARLAALQWLVDCGDWDTLHP